jgi:hypothetical protein
MSNLTSYTIKELQINFTLESGTFANGSNTLSLSGLRAEVEIVKAGHPSKNQAKIKVFGMTQSDMNSLTTLPAKSEKPLAIHKSRISILAGDTTSPLKVAFGGEISGAWTSYESSDQIYFHVEALAGFYPAIAPASPTGYNGGVSVANLMSGLAAQMGYTFENNGVNSFLHNQYISGSSYQQASQIAEAANIEFGIDDDILFIAPRGVARKGTSPVISPNTGLKGYPIFDKKGLKFTCLYNNGLKLGGLVTISNSVVSVANGTWRINKLEHKLSSLMPNGAWFSQVSASWEGN